jgi:hypothetical protein
MTNTDNSVTESEVPESPDSTSAPIIYYDFTLDYIDKLLDKASRIKEEES